MSQKADLALFRACMSAPQVRRPGCLACGKRPSWIELAPATASPRFVFAHHGPPARVRFAGTGNDDSVEVTELAVDEGGPRCIIGRVVDGHRIVWGPWGEA